MLDTRDILRMATLEGAKAAHLAGRIGSLTPGKQADIAGRLVDVDTAAVATALQRSADGIMTRSGYPDVLLTTCR